MSFLHENENLTESRNPAPLCVDLDGTLTLADLSIESLLRVVRQTPWVLFLFPLWLLRGKAHVKTQLARRGGPDVSVLPYNQAVIELVRDARAANRQVVLVTGSHESFARQVQAHVGLIDDVMATDEEMNLSGRRKAAALTERFGKDGFEYAGNAHVDLAVWEAAGSVITVNAPRGVVARARALGKPHRDFPGKRVGLRGWLKAIRIHQWAKNALVFVPLITTHQILDPTAILAALLAFYSFGLLASATYIVNDLFDLDSDRHHRTKHQRPFASGAIPATHGLIVSGLLLLGSAVLASLLPLGFQVALAAYLMSTLLYTFRLKRIASLDVLVLAALYTLRIIAGALAIGVFLSFWLLAFSMFIFLCLALVKRVSELIELQRRAEAAGSEPGRAQGREYDTSDIPVLQNLGAASGYLAVLVLALYINSPEVSVLYRTPEILWLIAPVLLLWVTRLWVMTTRGFMDDDPIVFAIKDPETWIAAGLIAILIAMAAVLKIDWMAATPVA